MFCITLQYQFKTGDDDDRLALRFGWTVFTPFFKVRFQGKMYTLDVVCFLEVQLVSWQPVVGAVDVGRLHHQQGAGRLTLVPHTEHYHGGS